MNKIFTVILLVVAVASLVYTGANMKKISSMEEEINKFKAEKIELMREHEECEPDLLEYRSQCFLRMFTIKQCHPELFSHSVHFLLAGM